MAISPIEIGANLTQVLLALIAVLSATIALLGHYFAERRQAELISRLDSNKRSLDVITNGQTPKGEKTNV